MKSKLCDTRISALLEYQRRMFVFSTVKANVNRRRASSRIVCIIFHRIFSRFFATV